MKKAIYPCWCDIPCAECGRVLKIFCFSSKDFKQHLHFCEEWPCLQNYYYKKLPLKSAKSTISRLLTMRHYRNEKVSMYHDKSYNDCLSTIEKEMDKPKAETLMNRIDQSNQEYIRQLRLQKGIRDDQEPQDTKL